MIRDISESFVNAALDRVGRIAGRAQESRPLPTDLLESDDAYLVVFDAPDTNIEDVQVRFSDMTVHVRIDRVRKHREGFEMRFPGRGLALDGQVTLPADATVDPDNATATLTDDGTLRVELPKVEEPADGPIRISTDEPMSEGTSDEPNTDDETDEGTGTDSDTE